MSTEKLVTDSFVIDEQGMSWFKRETEEGVEYWESMEEISIKAELAMDRYIRSVFPGGLVDENDIIQLRVVAGRLTWIKANKSEEKWQELTPTVAKKIEAGKVLVSDDESDDYDTPEPIKNLLSEKPVQKELRNSGWYQNLRGDLYHFDGTNWLGNVPSKNQIEDLEYLG